MQIPFPGLFLWLTCFGSTPLVTDEGRAWSVDFYLPNIVTSDKASSIFVRAVHGKPRSMVLEANEKTVIDKSTGLMWARFDQLDDPAFVTPQGEFIRLSWAGALEACENLNFAGFDDWRMPNIKEMMSIIKTDRVAPAYDTEMFSVLPGRNDRWWSSTTVTGSLGLENPGTFVWKVGTWSGDISSHSKIDAAEITYVHPVRTVTAAPPPAQ